MCDYSSASQRTLLPNRETRKDHVTTTQNSLRLPRYPRNVNITGLDTPSISTVGTVTPFISNLSSSSLSPYWCNRGLGVLLKNHSIVCFCPPQYYGEKCQYHADRLSVLLRLNLRPVLNIWLFSNSSLFSSSTIARLHQLHLFIAETQRFDVLHSILNRSDILHRSNRTLLINNGAVVNPFRSSFCLSFRQSSSLDGSEDQNPRFSPCRSLWKWRMSVTSEKDRTFSLSSLTLGFSSLTNRFFRAESKILRLILWDSKGFWEILWDSSDSTG